MPHWYGDEVSPFLEDLLLDAGNLLADNDPGTVPRASR